MGSLLFIATATLTPGSQIPSGAMRPNFWCFACGAEGAADVTLNIALFVPLGVALSLLGVGPIRALLAGLLLSLSVECAQRFGWPPDRIASATDLMTNTGGAFVGALIGWYRATWLDPSARAARVLTTVSVVTAFAFLAFTAWALGPKTVLNESQPMPTGIQLSRFPYTPGYGWYQGHVSEAVVDGQPFTHQGDGPLMLRGIVQRELSGNVSVSGRDERREFIPFLYVHDMQVATPELMLGQEGRDARMQSNLRGQRLRFPGPSIVLRDAFPESANANQTLSFSVTPSEWRLSSTGENGTRAVALPISVSLGWTLLQTVVHVGDHFGTLTSWFWLFVMWLPIGYWSALAGRSDSRWSVAGAGLALALTLGIVPATFGIANCSMSEWGSAIGGMALGVFFAARHRAGRVGFEFNRVAH